MGRIFKVVNIVLTLILIITACAIAYVAIPFFGNQALIVRSGSMQPTIDIGSIVVVRESKDFVSPLANTALYKIGDIIAFRSESNPKTLITHRVAGVEQDTNGVYYKTKGDANKSPDGWQVEPSNILGKVYFTLPYVGKLLAFAKSDKGFPFLIIFPAIFVVLIEAINIIREILKNKKREPEFRLSSLKIFIPILALGLIIPATFAFSADTETSPDNSFQAAATFPTPTITPTPIQSGPAPQ